MKWVLKKSKKKRKTKNHEPVPNVLELELKKQLIDVYSQNIIDYLLLQMIDRDLNRLVFKILDYLSSGDDDPDEAALLLDELARQRGVYREYDKKMSSKATEMYMKKVRFAALELKKRSLRYNNTYKSKGRSR